ncbi:MAG: AAA family ATPase [Pseudomonadota bacterium]
MRFASLWLKAYGPFQSQVLDFEGTSSGLQFVYGPNEAGKSSALRALTVLLYGIPGQTRDGFRHEYSALRVGAVLLTDDGRRLAVMRRKGTKATLFEFDEETGQERSERPLPPDTLTQLLGSVDQTTFLTMFGIDHARLREGGKSLLEGRGEVGQSLFQAASGLAGVRKVLAAIDAEAAGLFAPRAQNPTVNAAIREYADLKKRLKETLVRPKAWKEREEAFNQAETKVQGLQQQIQNLRAEEKLLTRLQATLPVIAQRDLLIGELAELSGVPLLSDDAVQRRVAAQTALDHANRDSKGATALISSYESELAGLHVPEVMLASGPEIEALRHDEARAANAKENIQAQRTLLSANQKIIDELLGRLAPRPISGQAPQTPRENARSLLPDRTEVAKVRDLAIKISEATRDVSSLRQQTADLDHARDTAKADLAELPEAPDLSALATTVEALTRQGDLEAQADKAVAEVATLANRLADEVHALGLADRADLRRLPVPQDSEIDQFRQAFEQHRESLAKLDTEEKSLRRDLDEVRAELSGLEAVGEVVTADKVQGARRHRDEGWSLIRLAYIERRSDPSELASNYTADGDLPPAYETAVRQADVLADELRADTERATRYAELAKRADQMRTRLVEIASEREAASTADQQRRGQWNTLIASLGLHPLDPESFKQWLTERRRVLQLFEHHDQAIVKRDAALGALQRARASLIAACKEAGMSEPDAFSSLSVALNLTRKTVTDAKNVRDARERAQREVTRLHGEVARCGSRLKVAEGQLAEVHHQWNASVAKLYLSSPATTAEAEARIEDLERLRETLGEADRLNTGITKEQAFLDEYHARAVRLASALGLETPLPDQVSGFAETLYAELEKGRAAAQRKSSLEESIRSERERLTRSLAARDSALAELDLLVNAAGCTDAAGLPEAEARSQRRRKAETQLADIEKQLVTQWKAPLDSLLAEAVGCTVDSVEERLSEVQRQLPDLEPQLSAAQEAVADARREYLAIDGTALAAELREEAESLLARMRHDAERYARLRLARSLLERGIRSHQEQAQGPLLTRASHYFGLMTGGRYPKLRVDFEGDAQVILAESPGGSDLHVSDMSEGTADQLFLALRLGAIEMHLDNGHPIPIILDDVLLAFDDERAGFAIRALADLAERTQVLVFTHHRHIVEIAGSSLSSGSFGVTELR